jgi:hypothetical protein
MAIIEFSRTNAQGQTFEFKCCVGTQQNGNPTFKDMYDNEYNAWLMHYENGVPIAYHYKGVADEPCCEEKSVTIKYDVLSLSPDFSAITRGGLVTKTQKWNDPKLIAFLEPIKFNTFDKCKRGINGILEREFKVMPIFDPMSDQEAVVLESDMYPLVVAFQTHLASL